MLKRKLLLWILGLALLLPFGLKGQEVDSTYQLLWEVSGNGLSKPSWLFGTFHTRDARAFRFPDSLMIALDRCEAVATELDPDSLMQYSYLIQLATDGQDHGYQHLYGGPSKFEIDDKGNLKGFPVKDIPQLSEWLYDSQDFFSSLNSRSQYPTFLDAFLFRVGVVHGKKFYPMETVAEQLRVYEERYEENEADENEEELEDEEDNPLNSRLGIRKEMIRLYQAGDIEAMNVLMVKLHNTKKQYYKALIDDRNHVMADRMDQYMKQHSIFVAVGAGHLGGPEGVVQLLRQKGYHLRPVTATFSGKAHAFRSPEVEVPWQKIRFEQTQLGAAMPTSAFKWPLPQWNTTICYAPDVSTGTAYFLFPFDMRGMGKWKNKKLLDNLKDAINALPGYRFNGEEKWTDGSVEGRTWTFKLKNDQKMYMKAGINGQRGYIGAVILPTSIAPHKDIDRFWSGIQWGESQPSMAWKKWTEDGLGFSVEMPGDRTVGQIPDDFDDGVLGFSDYWAADDLESRIHYRVLWQDPGLGNYHSNDTTSLQEVIEAISAAVGCNQEQVAQLSMDQGHLTADANLSDNWTDHYYQVKAVLQGSRIILFIAASNKREGLRFKAAPFFSSIQTHQPKADPLSFYASSDSSYSAMMPVKRKYQEENIIKDYPYWDEVDVEIRHTLAGNGKNTGFVYSLVFEEYSPFAQFESDSAFFRDAIDIFVDEDTEIDRYEFKPYAGMPSADYYLNMRSSEQKIRIREIWNGKGLVSLIQVYLPSQAHLGADAAWNSLEVKPAEKGFDFKADKRKLVVESLFSRDSSLVSKAARKINAENTVDSTAKPAIWAEWKALSQMDDSQMAFIAEKLIGVILLIADTNDIPLLSEHYLQLPDSAQTRKDILFRLARIEGPQGGQAFANLATQSPPTQLRFFEGLAILNGFRDTASYSKVIFPQLFNLIGESELGPDVLDLFDFYTQSKYVSANDYPELYPILKKMLETAHNRDRRETHFSDDEEEGDWDPEEENAYDRSMLLRLLALYEPKGSDGAWEDVVIQYYREFGDPEEQLAATLCQLTRGYPISHSRWREFGPSTGLMRSLYNSLKTMDKLDWFPKDYISQDSFAVNDLCAYVGFSGPSDGTVEIISKFRNDLIGEGKFVFFCKVVYADNEEEYAAFSGSFQDDANNLESTEEWVGDTYTIFDEYSPEEHWEYFSGD